MISIREATWADVDQIRDIYVSSYGGTYAYPQYYDTDSLKRFVYADGSLMLVAEDSASQSVVGTASVVFGIGAHNDLVGEFGR